MSRYSSRRANNQRNTAKVGFGESVLQDVNVMLVDADFGENVAVHAGYAIQVIDRKAAEENS